MKLLLSSFLAGPEGVVLQRDATCTAPHCQAEFHDWRREMRLMWQNVFTEMPYPGINPYKPVTT
jgi:hypothetical protein